MKLFYLYCCVFLTLLSAILTACQRDIDYQEPVTKDASKPEPPGNIKVINFNGGADIVYDLPASKNILYVLAEYTINDSTGATRQTKTSYYNDTTRVEGFAKSKDYTISLKTVTRANIASDPVYVTVHPDIPTYQLVADSLVLEPTFGGVTAKSMNWLGQGVTLVYLYDDPIYSKYVIREQRYFDARQISYPMRGFDTLPKRFGAYVTDRWGNKSQVTYATINPIFEIKLDKTLFKAYPLASDIPTQGGDPLSRMWDNNYSSGNFWHSQWDPIISPDPVKPYTVSFSIGEARRLSRFTLNQRYGWDPVYWSDGALEKFSIWGSTLDLPRDAKLPESAAVGAVAGDWINLGNFDFPNPPSGNPPGSATQADKAWWSNGVDFEFPESQLKVKHLRVAISKTWGNRPGSYINELTLFGGK